MEVQTTYKSHRCRLISIIGVALLVAAACGGTTPAATTAPTAAGGATAATVTQPTRPAEFVISTGPGGGSDIYARFMRGIIEELKLSPQPVQPTNKDGASGAVAYTYVYDKKGDMHYVMITLNSFWTTIITQKLPYKATEFTPIANLALDPFYLWVNADSPWKTAADVVKAAQEKELVVSGTGSKQEDEVMFRRIQEIAKTKTFRYVPESGGGKVAAALAGKQGGVEVTVNNPSEGLGLLAQKKIRAICAFTAESPKAPAAVAGLPTCKSQGLAIDDYFNVRAVLAPPGLKPEQQKFWVDVFQGVFKSEKWTKFMTDNALTPDFRTGIDFRQFIEKYQKIHEDSAKANKWV
ncbi:MAG: tripartite tricarboxylate transporter substrate binding protein [Chloroflexota bacterium]